MERGYRAVFVSFNPADDEGDNPVGLPGELARTIATIVLLGLLPHPPQLEQMSLGKLESSPNGEDECDPNEDTETR